MQTKWLNWFLLLSLILIQLSCFKNREKGIKGFIKLSEDQMIERARVGNWPNPSIITYILESGDTISRDSMNKLNYDSIAFDDYIDTTGVVKLAIIRPASKEDLKIREKMLQAFEEGPKLEEVVIDCSNIKAIIDRARMRDQENRKNIKSYSYKVDHENLEVITSLIDQCGMPTLKSVNAEQMQSIWLILQHSKTKYQEQYLPLLKQAAENGDLNIRNVLMMEDRIRISKKLPQIYGTQICKDSLGNSILCEVIDMPNLNVRRREVGFEPIEEYLMHWGIEAPKKLN